ncbi:hypothetical protein DOTSEDRAFT_54369 [Dothistroma septosporum NZE10]|uniref:Carrier domain-containing protein n=1 Tax=Dothistroma septosporum (strain NZE10 / CBS 128990) TaxID=675120 RepID=M2YPQ1_DOTSN|nr:hypothetical protein DOTSEDRAFT_54369 [Dothistroma septosporum NZE10]
MSHGERTLPWTIDDLAKTSGDRVWARYPVSPEAFERGELRQVTFADLANAINRLAWHLETILAGHDDLETICYIGPSDIRYFILACAACKCRLQALFSSPRNNVDAHVSLLEKTGCRILLGPIEGSRDSTLETLRSSRDLKYDVIPPLEELLNPEAVECFRWERSLDDVAKEPFLVLHTSGSTGLPKPVSISHGLISTIDAQQDLQDVDGRCVTARRWAGISVYTALPPFHSAGINFFSFSVFQSTQLVFGPCDQPPSLKTVQQILRSHATDAAVLPPSLLAEVAMDGDLLREVSQWSSVALGGGPLPKEAGDALWERTRVLKILGSTETFNVPELEPRSIDEWEYHCFHPGLGIDFRPHSDQASELVFHRDRHITRHQGAFWTFPDQDEYSMKDLYEQHPSKPGHWKYRGRVDDVIVLSNGEKFNPTGAERIITRDPAVKSALIVGAAREQPMVLVEPLVSSKKECSPETIVETVAQANEILPAHAQIHSSHVRVLDPSDTFLRSSKGEIRRAPTNAALGAVIAEVYEKADQNVACASTLDFRNEQSLSASLTSVLSEEYLENADISETDNVFECGLDSIRAVKLLRYFKAGLRQQGVHDVSVLAPKAIYEHPTARLMANMLTKMSAGDALDDENKVDPLANIRSTFDTFATRLDNFEKSSLVKAVPTKVVVLLTGSTGSLGSYILDSLIRNHAVHKIICLNRPGSCHDKQFRTTCARGLSTDFTKVKFLQSDATKPRLGLTVSTYDEVSQTASHIIHNAWPVNFNLPLKSFDQQLEICCNLMELANASSIVVDTRFMSSVGAANNWSYFHDGPVPEALLDDFRVSEEMGYAQSKQLAELLFARAGELFDIPVTVCRLGQIAGPVKSEKGKWSPQEWFPSILLSCKSLGKVPESLGAMDCMDWIPVDLLGDMLVETMLPGSPTPSTISQEVIKQSLDLPSTSSESSAVTSAASSLPGSPELLSSRTSIASGEGLDTKQAAVQCLHFVNPSKVWWKDIVHSLFAGGDGDVQVVQYEDWLRALSEAAEREDMSDNVPAVRLLGFFGDIGRPEARRPEFSTKLAQRRSSSLKNLEPVSVRWLRQWWRQWQAAVD